MFEQLITSVERSRAGIFILASHSHWLNLFDFTKMINAFWLKLWTINLNLFVWNKIFHSVEYPYVCHVDFGLTTQVSNPLWLEGSTAQFCLSVAIIHAG